jgi:hypothetical protein
VTRPRAAEPQAVGSWHGRRRFRDGR